MRAIRARLRLYWPLIKSLQTGLLLATGMAGYMSARCPVFNLPTLSALTVTLFLSISGSTVLNMWYDRDIDARMQRTRRRPSASGSIPSRHVFTLGAVLAAAGVAGALALDPKFGVVVFAGLLFDVIVYTVWLKRRTCWSILWGGISGAMPILAGRVLALGQADLIGILLALSVLFWIPTHILTFSLKYQDDYRRAGLPTFPSTYGESFTRAVIAISSVLAALAISAASMLIGVQAGYLRLIGVMAAGLLLLAFAAFRVQSEQLSFGLFKYASIYQLSAMVILAVQGLA